MRRILVSLMLVLLLGANISCSSESGADRRAGTDMDALFQRLRTTSSQEEAQAIEITIRHVWSQSGRQGVDAQMIKAVEAIHGGDLDTALALANTVVGAAPEYVEGWNLRATIHYLRDEHGEAVADIERVLALEPRHFGALAGLGRIFLELKEKKAALIAFEMALSIHPHLAEIRSEMATLREELAGVPI
jgi:tetratricopeptide (TPR) repeat protein